MSRIYGEFAATIATLKRRLREPLLLATLAAIAGILLADRGFYSPVSAVAAVALGGGFALVYMRKSFLLLAVAGGFAFAHHERREHTFGLPFADELLAGERLLVEVEGTVDSQPKTSSTGRVSFFLTLTELRKIGDPPVPTDQRIYVSLKIDPPPRYGDRLAMVGHLQPARPPRNLGEFDFGKFLERKGVIAQFWPRGAEGVRVLSHGHGNPVFEAAAAGRKWVGSVITRDLARSDPEIAAVLTAMTLGDRSDTRDELIESFRTSGTLHIFAVSGLHVGLIGVILWQLLSLLPIHRRYSAMLIIAVLCCYAFVTGLRPSAVRATIMACLVLSAPLIDREPRVINSLGAAGIVILAFDSNQLFLPGFQLSFAVLLALTLLHKPILGLLLPLISPDPFIPAALLSDRERNCYRGLHKVAETFAVSCAAWLGSLPLMIYHFHLVTPIAPIANLFLIPIAFCVLAASILSVLAFSTGLTTVSILLNNANFLIASALTATAGFFANLPVPLSHFYAAEPNFTRPPLEITVMDLPRGGASTLISSRAHADWLLDTGNSRDFRQTLTGTLHEHAGVTRIDALILSHTDAGHIGGATEVIDTFRPEVVYLPVANNSSATYRKLKATLEGYPGTTLQPAEDDILQIDGNSSLRVLHRNPDRRARISDDACMVLLLESYGWRVLFTADAGFYTEKALLDERPQDLAADLIIRGSHGSDHSLMPDFLTAVSPAAVVSAARHFEDESPSQRIWMDALGDRGIQLFDQAQTGAVSVTISARQLTVSGLLNGQTLTLRR